MTADPVPASGTVAAYDRIAEDWDRGLGFRAPHFAARMRSAIVRLLTPAAGGSLALELGAGTGWLLDVTSPLFRELRAIEPSVPMREICRRRIVAEGLRNVSVQSGDATTLDGISGASVDAIYAVGLLDAVPDVAGVLLACERVLKPDGLLVLSTANGSCPWYAWRDRVQGTGDVRTGTYLTGPALVHAARLAGLTQVEVLTWGAAPQRMTLAPAVAAFGMLEQVVTSIGLSRYLGVLTASFRKVQR